MKSVTGVKSLIYRRKQYVTTRSEEAGFSLVELLTVCMIMVILSAIAIPNIVRVNAIYKLDAAGHSLASLLQQARMQAVKLNQPQYAQYDPATGKVFVNSDGSNAYVQGNADVGLPGGISFQNAGPSNHADLDTYLGYTAASGNQPPVIGGSIGFNTRGLPCTANGGPAVCPSSTAGYEWFVQNGNRGWAAVTVTPAGRIKSWHSSDPSGGSWQ